MKFDPTRPVRTRKGRPARIICADRHWDKYPIVALVVPSWGGEEILCYTADGRTEREDEDEDDLVNIPEKHVRWVNFYQTPRGPAGGGEYVTRQEADEWAAGTPRLACVRIEFEEGEGLR
jgi:hypothetical protein